MTKAKNDVMTVAKFGGSSLADSEGFKRVCEIVKENGIPVVIVSAPGGKPKTTDLLIEAYREWERSGNCGKALDEACERFLHIAAPLGIDISGRLNSLRADINSGCGFDHAVSRGEYLGAVILSKVLGYNFVDATDCVKLTLDGRIDYDSILAHGVLIKTPCVIPGFYGKLPNGKLKLLPRGGSDISGAAIAAAVKGEYVKWTDVDGIYDGSGGIIEKLGYDEAELLCYFGASVMHYEAIPILKKAGLKLTVKNTFNCSAGTLISGERSSGRAFSKRTMFMGGDEAARHAAEIESEGLKIPFRASLLGRTKILIDDCGFSPLALRRILRYDDIVPVVATAAIGNAPVEGDLLFRAPFGAVYVKPNETSCEECIIRQNNS